MAAPQGTGDMKASGNHDGASTIGGSTLNDTSSLAPPTDASDHASSSRKKSWTQRLFSHSKKDRNDENDDGSSEKKGRKKSIADSGPYIFAFDPAQGKEVLQKNPHWPNEDSWKREKESEGKWAFGSMMGENSKDFGGTVG